MDADNQQQQPQQNMNSGLTRYRSAPSSYFSYLTNNSLYEDDDINPFLNPRASSPETERMLSRFMSNGDQYRGNEFQDMVSMKQEQVTFSSPSRPQQQQHMMYQNHVPSQQVVHNNSNLGVSSSSSGMVDPVMLMDPTTSLVRQSSSPAGFFENINMDNGYSGMRPMDKFSSLNRSKSRMGFESGSHSSSRVVLSRIPENEGKNVAHNNVGYPSFPVTSWDESAILTERFLKEFGESDRISSSEDQNDEGRIQSPNGLVQQLSLPASLTEMSAMEKLMQFQDNVPLRSRAKRGCATHPRSIAERVRRTRISERMRRLQDLVPNMDKQTNTADMLDLAVDYIKELQKQVETLSDCHARCTCPHKQKL